MTLNIFSKDNRTVLTRAAFATALICSMTAFPCGVYAQEISGGGKQLPSDFAQKQVPPSFPDANQGSTGTSAADAMPKPATDSEKAAAVAAGATPKAVPGGTAPGGTQAQTQTVTSADATATAASAPPAETKLVPARAMGAAAQSADSGASAAAQADASSAADSASAPNPVEDAAAAMDKQEAAAEENAPAQNATTDVLDKYTARADEAAAQRDAEGSEPVPGDALPKVSNLNMVKLEGSGFENSGNKRVTVGVDGTVQGGKTQAQLQEEIRTEAFDAAITGMFPLSPEQVKNLLKRYDTTQKAVKTPVYDEPKPEISVQNISLDPGVAPPTIKTAVGNVTTLNILDATGAPWPVQDVTWAGDFEIVEPEEGGHIIRITPMGQFARGNIVIRMLTLKTPLTMTLETSRDTVQYRVDARIPEYGPFASAPIMQGGKSLVAGSPDLTSLLDGVMPGGFTKLKVSGVDGRTTAYENGGNTYVRTPLTLLSPAWHDSVSSADGMNVYALNSSPVLLLSDGGEFVRATLSEKEDLLDE